MRNDLVMSCVFAAGIFIIGLLSGCGATAPTPVETVRPLAIETFMPYEEAYPDEEIVEREAALSGVDLSELPSAPWAAAPIPLDEVPGPFLAAWTNADNRAVCAPIAPASLGVATGAEARVSQLVEGGWAVEFDRRGMPGMTADGTGCRRCGLGVIGVAGTSMSPDQVVIAETGDGIAPSFADGSHLSVEAPSDGENVAAATLALSGQGCVYQVWSHLGEDNLREVVESLRRVAVASEAPVASR